MTHPHKNEEIHISAEAGMALIEILASVLILMIMAVGVSSSVIYSFRSYKISFRNSIAEQLALEKLEEYAAINPTNLDDNDDSVENGIEVSNVLFTRSVDVTVNADNSRTVVVTVQNEGGTFGGDAVFSTDFALWGDA